MVIAKKKVTAAKSAKKPVTSATKKVSEVACPSLWSLSTQVEDCSYDLVGVRSVIEVYAESDGYVPRVEALWLACREMERIEGRLFALAEVVLHYKEPK